MAYQYQNHEYDRANFYHLSLEELIIIYPAKEGEPASKHRNRLRNLQNYHRRKPMPPRNPEYDGNPEAERERAEQRQKKSRRVAKVVTKNTVSIEVPPEHLPFHEQLQEALSDEGIITKATFTSGEHTGYIKNSDNEIEYTEPLVRKGIKFEVKFDHEPKWPVVQRVESVKLPKKEAKIESEAERVMIMPDIQLPFGDKDALDIALQVMADYKPHKVVFVGDALDLTAWSKYEQRPEYATATQGAIVELHQLLSTIRRMLPSSEIVMMAGNHEKRMETALLRNAQAAYGLKRADQLDNWPVMSVPYLCAFDQLGVEYIDGYPANRYWLNERLQVRHGSIARPGGKTAPAVANDEKVSTIFGHIHRIEQSYKTVNVFGGGRTNAAYSIGCLARIDGHVPSTKAAFDSRTQQPVENYENWQHGFLLCDVGKGDAPFYPQQIFINTFSGYETVYNGKVYRPRPSGGEVSYA